MTLEKLKQKVICGTFLGISEKIVSHSLLFLSQIIMMRILSSKEYGQIGMLAIFMAVSMIFIDSGFGNALIQKKLASGRDFSTAFWLSNIIGSLCYLSIFLGAPAIAEFYGDPELILLARVLGINVFFCAIGIVPQAILIKQMKFGSMARLSILSYFISGVIGVLLAYQGAGVWSIVGQMLSLYLIRSLLVIWETKWLPIIFLDRNSVRALTEFGSKMLISNLLDQFFLNLHVSIVGKFAKPQVGYFSQANRFCWQFLGLFTVPIHNVTMSTMSSSSQQRREIQKVFKQFIQMAAFFTFPTILLVISIAEPALMILLGDKWLPVVPIFMWLCASGLFSTIYLINQNVLKSNNRTDLLLISNIIRKSFLLVSVLVGIRWGVQGILIGYFCCSILDFFVNAFFTFRIINITIFNQFIYIWRILLISCLMFIIVMLSDNLQINNYVLDIIVKFTIAIIVYLSGSLLFCKESIAEALTIPSTLFSNFFSSTIQGKT